MKGRFGPYGGQYVPETLMSALEQLEGAWSDARSDPEFRLELAAQHHDPAVGVDADWSLGNRPIAEQLAFHLAHETDVV